MVVYGYIYGYMRSIWLYMCYIWLYACIFMYGCICILYLCYIHENRSFQRSLGVKVDQVIGNY